MVHDEIKEYSSLIEEYNEYNKKGQAKNRLIGESDI